MFPLPNPSLIDKGAIAAAEAIHNSIVVFKASYEEFWARNPDVILAELNANAEYNGTLFGLRRSITQANNGFLDFVNDERFPTRAPVDMPAGWTFDETNGFSYTPPNVVAE
jgi:hypothetical protein